MKDYENILHYIIFNDTVYTKSIIHYIIYIFHRSIINLF